MNHLRSRPRVAVIGAGNVGATCAQRLAETDICDIVLIDVVPGLAAGKALDMNQAGPICGYETKVTGTEDWSELKGSQVVVVTAGAARKPGMSRDDLLRTNQRIVSSVTDHLKRHAPETIVIAVTNPLDAMAHLILKESGLPRERVIGMAGILDDARFRTFVAERLGVARQEVSSLLLGGHGDSMLPLPRVTTVGGVPVQELIPTDELDAIVQRTRDGGAEIVGLLGSGSAFYAPSAAAAQMVVAILLDQKRVLPCSILMRGEFGVDGVFMGVPVRLGSAGAEGVIEVALTDEESARLHRSAADVRELTKSLGL